MEVKSYKIWENAGETDSSSACVKAESSNEDFKLEKNDWKQKIRSPGLWWKIILIIALVAVLIFVVFKIAKESNTSSPKRELNLNISSEGGKFLMSKAARVTPKPKLVTERVVMKNKSVDNLDNCTKRSIGNSYASFLFRPSLNSELYRTNGLEFSFEAVARKIGDESKLTELNKVIAGTSRIHYYYNIDRCRIGGGVRIDKKPYIRGPIVFAVDQECSKVYYFLGRKGWKKYNSATNISCSSHGSQTVKTVTQEKRNISLIMSMCSEGSIKNSYSSFSFVPPNYKPYRTNGLEFPFSVITKKPGAKSSLTELNDTASSDIHYYYNIDRCRIGGGIQIDKQPYIRGPIVFAVDQQCEKVYYFSESKGWTKYRSATGITCSSHGRQATCSTEKSIKDSYASFTYLPWNSAQLYPARGLEFPFSVVAKKIKLESSLIDLNKMAGAPKSSKFHYYYNIDRCRIGGGIKTDKKPYIRGPIVFAVDQECSEVYYFIGGKGWIKYNSASNITCSSHGRQFCIQGAGNDLNWMFSRPENKITALEFGYNILAQKLMRSGQHLKPVDNDDNAEFHYLLNMKTCFSTDPKDYAALNLSIPLVLAVNHNCTMAYAFDVKNSKWQRHTQTEPLSCSWKDRSWCEKDSVEHSFASFQFTTMYDGQKPKVTGVQYNFTSLVRKLHGLITNVNLNQIIEINSTKVKDATYYLNLNRCLNGGLSNLNASPQIRGPLFFAVSNSCTKVYYFSSKSLQWKTYNSAFNISCNDNDE